MAQLFLTLSANSTNNSTNNCHYLRSIKKLLKLGYTTDNLQEWHGLYLPSEDRATHLYVIGSSGVDKSRASL